MFERLQASKGIRQSQLLQYYTTKCMKKMWNNFQMAGKLIRQASKGEKFAGQRRKRSELRRDEIGGKKLEKFINLIVNICAWRVQARSSWLSSYFFMPYVPAIFPVDTWTLLPPVQHPVLFIRRKMRDYNERFTFVTAGANCLRPRLKSNNIIGKFVEQRADRLARCLDWRETVGTWSNNLYFWIVYWT